MCRTHLLQVLDPLKVGETHANMQAAPRARAPKKPSGGPKPATRRSERLLEIPAGPSFVDNEYKNGSVGHHLHGARAVGHLVRPPIATRSQLCSVRTSCIGH